ncbi:MAG TPA: hypothetical protein VF331_24595 [Polyangiales bacterium]
MQARNTLANRSGHALAYARSCATGACCSIAVLLCWLATSRSVAREPTAPAGVQIHVAAPETIPDGTHTAVTVTVDFAQPNDQPLLLTPTSQGSALEVVRGRLSRSDARRISETQLRFELPVVAHGEGTAIVHVELAAYVCKTRCERVVASADQVVRIARR